MSNTYLFIVGLFVGTLSVVGILTNSNSPKEYEQFSGVDPRLKNKGKK